MPWRFGHIIHLLSAVLECFQSIQVGFIKKVCSVQKDKLELGCCRSNWLLQRNNGSRVCFTQKEDVLVNLDPGTSLAAIDVYSRHFTVGLYVRIWYDYLVPFWSSGNGGFPVSPLEFNRTCGIMSKLFDNARVVKEKPPRFWAFGCFLPFSECEIKIRFKSFGGDCLKSSKRNCQKRPETSRLL